MHPFHVFVSIVNIIFGLAFLVVIYSESNVEALATITVIGGYFSNLIAILLAMVTFIAFIIKCFSRGGKKYIKNNWLGIFNGVFVIAFWALFILYSSYEKEITNYFT